MDNGCAVVFRDCFQRNVFIWHDEPGGYLGQWVLAQGNTFILYDASSKVVGLTT